MNNFQSIFKLSFARTHTQKSKQNDRAVCRRARFNCERKRIKKKKKKERGNKEKRKITFNQAPARMVQRNRGNSLKIPDTKIQMKMTSLRPRNPRFVISLTNVSAGYFKMRVNKRHLLYRRMVPSVSPRGFFATHL